MFRRNPFPSLKALFSSSSTATPSSSSAVKLERPASFSPTKKENHSDYDYSRKQFGVGSISLLILPCISFSLGIWQIKRRKQKLEIIGEMDAKIDNDPVELPLNLDDLGTMEYQSVLVRGRFDHSRELVIKPRSRLDKTSKFAGPLIDGFSNRGEKFGAQVVTPFILSDRKLAILVNRGWVPTANIDPSTRQKGQVEGEITLCGVVRKSEKRPTFVGHNHPEIGHWKYRHIRQMADWVGTDPVYIEANFPSSSEFGPVGGQTVVNIRNEHMQYIITWFSLSAITSYMWYLRFIKGR